MSHSKHSKTGQLRSAQCRSAVQSIGLIAFFTLWVVPSLAANLDGCWRMSAQQKNIIESYEFDCIAERIRCETLIMNQAEAEAKVEEINAWNEANAPYKWRKLKSGFGPCTDERQVFIVEERTNAEPPAAPVVEPHWERGNAEQVVYVDRKGQRWRFAKVVRTGRNVYYLDTRRQPVREAKGVLVQMVAWYSGPPGVPPLKRPGTMERNPAPSSSRGTPRYQGTVPGNRRPTREVLCARNPHLYSCLPE